MSSGGIYRGPGGDELHGDGRPVFPPIDPNITGMAERIREIEAERRDNADLFLRPFAETFAEIMRLTDDRMGDAQEQFKMTSTQQDLSFLIDAIRAGQLVDDVTLAAMSGKMKSGPGYYIEPFESRRLFRRPAYRWRVVASNGEIVLTNGQPINRRIDRDRSMTNFANATGIRIVWDGGGRVYDPNAVREHAKAAGR